VVKGSEELLESIEFSDDLPPQAKVKIAKPKLVDINLLKLEKNNVKQHSKEQLHDLGVLFDWIGFTDPVIVDSDYEVWAGKGSVIEAKQKGMKKVPVVFMPEDWDESKKKHFMYRDNKINESPWIQENLQIALEEINPIELEEFQIKIDEYTPPLTEETGEIPEPPATPKSKLGDVYQLGRHRIMCGDATRDLRKLINDKKIDLLLTDPPYGINYKSPTGAGLIKRGDYAPLINDDKKFEPEFLLPLCDKIILWGANHYSDSLPTSRMWLVWDKREGDAINNNSDCELAWCSFGGSCRLFHHKWNGMIKASERDEKRAHPTQKPVKLFAWILDNWSNQNDIVLDPYLGSGSTLIACEQTGRTCVGMEISPAYVDVILERFENYSGQKAMKVKE